MRSPSQVLENARRRSEEMDALGEGVSRECQQMSAFSILTGCIGENQLNQVGEASALLPGHTLKLNLEFFRNFQRKGLVFLFSFPLHRLKLSGAIINSEEDNQKKIKVSKSK